MNSQKFVGIFNLEWQLVAVVQQGDGHLVVIDVLPHDYNKIIASVLERLRTEHPKLNQPVKDEHGCVIDMVRVGPEDERYMDGVANQFAQVGLQAYSLSGALLDAYKKVNEVSAGLRVQVVPDVVGLDSEHALVALNAII